MDTDSQMDMVDSPTGMEEEVWEEEEEEEDNLPMEEEEEAQWEEIEVLDNPETKTPPSLLETFLIPADKESLNKYFLQKD